MFFLKQRIDSMIDVRAIEEKRKNDGPIELEKGDMLALTLAAIRVFLPVALGFIAVIYGIYWLLMR